MKFVLVQVLSRKSRLDNVPITCCFGYSIGQFNPNFSYCESFVHRAGAGTEEFSMNI